MEQKELAIKTGLSHKTIENYVKKEASVPAADKAVLIAQALGVTVEYLVTGEKSVDDVKTGVQARKENTAIFAKLNDYNYELIISIAKILLNLQSGKKPGI